MSSDVTIQGGDVEIVLHVLGCKYAEFGDASAEWVQANLSIRAGSFAGNIDLDLWIPELMTLRDKLENVLIHLKDGLQFRSMESNWEFNVAFEASGSALISGRVMPRQSWDNWLHYEFRLDPISLESVARQIRQITESYPPGNRTVARTLKEIS